MTPILPLTLACAAALTLGTAGGYGLGLADRDVPVVVVSVSDGDTVRYRPADADPRPGRGHPLRLAGVDAPELHSPACPAELAAAIAATAYTAAAIRAAARVEVRDLRLGRGGYGRDLGRLILDGRDLSELLLAAGHAVPYRRGSDPDWCGGGE